MAGTVVLSRRFAAVAVVAAILAAGLIGARIVHAACTEVPLGPTTFDPVEACTGEGEQAGGTVAVSLQGDARATGPLRAAAVSGTGVADQSMVCVSGTGQAGGPHSAQSSQECVAGVSVAGSDGRWPDGTSRPASSGFLVSVSGTGTAQAPVAVSGTGDSRAQLVSVAGTGEARGDTYTGAHPDPYVAVSGCRAAHTQHGDPQGGQLLVADPTGVHVHVDARRLGASGSGFEPTDVGTGAAGTTVQGVTCPL
jgi:hypothetical protein